MLKGRQISVLNMVEAADAIMKVATKLQEADLAYIYAMVGARDAKKRGAPRVQRVSQSYAFPMEAAGAVSTLIVERVLKGTKLCKTQGLLEDSSLVLRIQTCTFLEEMDELPSVENLVSLLQEFF